MNSRKILILDNAIDHAIYRPVEHWRPFLVHPFEAFRASKGKFPPSLETYSHIIITGSESSILDSEDWILREERLVKDAANAGKVIVGSCYGHQMIARALFGMNAVRRREQPELGWPEIEVIESDPLVGEKGGIINSFTLHFDEVCNLPREAEVLARSKECGVLAFRLRGKPVWGIQPHPEIGTGEALMLIERLSPEGSPNREDFINGTMPLPCDSGWAVRLMREFQAVG